MRPQKGVILETRHLRFGSKLSVLGGASGWKSPSAE